MGVVRREGDWRLEKTGEGVYEITFRREPQVRVHTADAPPQDRNKLQFDTVPVRDVASYSEAEGLFEEKIHGPPPMGMSYSENANSTNWGTSSADGSVDDFDLDDLPPAGIAVTFLFAGGLILYTFWPAGNTLLLIIGSAFALGGLFPFAYAAHLFRSEDWRAAWDFLTTVDEQAESTGTTSEETETTPPPSEKLKNVLIFDRANQRCEWCEDRFDHPEVHHIEPRSEGGPNEPENLMVLCPNCHEKADREAIPRSKLKAKVERLPPVSLD